MKALHPIGPTRPTAQAQRRKPEAELREPELAGRAVANACTRRHWPPPAPRNGVRAVGLAMAWATARTPDHATHLGGRQNPPASQRRRRSTAELLSVPGLFSRSTPGLRFFPPKPGLCVGLLCSKAHPCGLRCALRALGSAAATRLPTPQHPSAPRGTGPKPRLGRRADDQQLPQHLRRSSRGKTAQVFRRSAAANVRAGAPAPGRAPSGVRAGRGRPPLRSRGQSGMGSGAGARLRLLQ